MDGNILSANHALDLFALPVKMRFYFLIRWRIEWYPSPRDLTKGNDRGDFMHFMVGFGESFLLRSACVLPFSSSSRRNLGSQKLTAFPIPGCSAPKIVAT
jgi:hypothetical protein